VFADVDVDGSNSIASDEVRRCRFIGQGNQRDDLLFPIPDHFHLKSQAEVEDVKLVSQAGL